MDDDTTFSHFTGIEIDGQAVAAENYTAAAGSVKIALNAAYLETLSVGSHTIKVLFDDGSAQTQFTVASPAVTAAGGAATGDPAQPVIWAVTALAAVVVISAVMAVQRSRKER